MASVINAVSNAVGINKIPHKQLGHKGPSVPQLGFGTMGLSAFYGKPKPDAERFAILDQLYEAGEYFWDTADMYGDSEDLLGEWFKQNPGKREKIFLASKFANCIDETGRRWIDSSPAYAKKACAKSLARLGVDHIDLYYVHRVDKETPIEKTMEALKELVEEGKIKYIGLSEVSADTLRRACKIHHVQAVQIEYSPFALEIESDEINVLSVARELGVAIVCYSPIGRGMFSGAIKSPDDFEEGDFRKMAPRFQPENFNKNLELVQALTAIADRKNITTAQLTLAWIMAQGDDFFPIPGTTNPKRLEENLGATKVYLSTEEEQEIRDACNKAEIAGTRYPAAFAAVLYADTPPL
ncbi:hypothetical protein AAFC00_004458 [Neodothiora populina]|uniref:NADP-dependent oxidoreductase domain-containing protein n=1 Tax=Neodothiora populina TaxID=2781224 RepID=A0ABR3P2L4_9PEZI